MLPVINNSEAFSRFLDLYREHNARGGTETHQRKCRASDGTYYYKDVTRKVNQIPESVKTTFYMILREYVASYNRTASQMPVGMYTAQDPPSLLTNRIRLSEACDCSDKTVYNHIETLGSLGVIRRKFHGRKKDFELWISTDLLFGNSGKDGAKNAQKTQKTAFSDEDRKNLPLNNIHREFLEKENRSADGSFCGYGENDHGERGRAGNPARTAGSPPTSAAGPPDGEMSTGGAARRWPRRSRR
ncbi:hypothetical protein [Salmonirosea aquatica]|uniref:Uncharacterized protein n=1 Tax=Salmonirosea aquatica TaxID=2654236 RepID=A0A7C9BJ98_9BACT|nr:hypothetical protein [Cytophagaceae bacterium SJW1-29]